MSEGISIRFVAVLVFLSTLAFTAPFIVQAVGKDADYMCLPDAAPDPCKCGPKFDPQKKTCSGPMTKYMCFCKDTTNTGITSGYCDNTFHCKGTAFSSAAGQPGGAPGMDQLMQALKGIMDALKGKGGGGGGGSPPPSSGTTGTQGCTSSYYQTSDASKSATDPCAYYVPGGSTDSGLNSYSNVFGSDPSALFNAYNALPPSGLTSPGTLGITEYSLSGSSTATQQSIKELLDQLNGGTTAENTSGNSNAPATASGGNTSSNSNTSSNASGNSANLNQTTVSGLTDIILFQLLGGARGNIEFTPEGATIYAATRDEKNNIETSGFYGSNTLGGKPQSLVARLCMTRPWASSTFSSVISPSFFDGLCTWQGYQVGMPAVASSTPSTLPPGPVSVRTNAPRPPVQQPTATSTPPAGAIPPQMDIWAVPAAVSLGARTAIFWNSRGASECLVISPDGNFYETRLSGGAATVPITTATTYTITCVSQDGAEATKSVIVRLRI